MIWLDIFALVYSTGALIVIGLAMRYMNRNYGKNPTRK